jgi:hypothetical protein
MAHGFDTNVDFLNHPCLNAVLEIIAGNPGVTPVDGRIWYDSTGPTVKTRLGGATVDMRDRAAQTGTQTAATISDFTTAVQALRWASMQPPNSSVAMNAQQFSGLATASSGGQAVEWAQFQTALAAIQVGLDFKEHFDIAALVNTSIAAPGATINGRTMAPGDRVMLLAQTTGSQAGLWTWNGAAVPLTRPADSPTGNTGAIVAGTVVEGYNGSTRVLYMQTSTGTGTNGAITVDTDAQTWTNPYPPVTLTAGYGISITGGTKPAFVPGTGMAAAGADGAAAGIDTTVVGRKITGTLPTATTGIFTVGTPSGGFTPVTINHQFGNDSPLFGLRYGSAGADPGEAVTVDNKPPTVGDGNNLTVKVSTTGLIANGYKFTLVG